MASFEITPEPDRRNNATDSDHNAQPKVCWNTLASPDIEITGVSVSRRRVMGNGQEPGFLTGEVVRTGWAYKQRISLCLTNFFNQSSRIIANKSIAISR